MVRPALSPHFPRQLCARLKDERQRLSAARRRLWWMQLYWMAACLACAVILSAVQWPAEGLARTSMASLLLALAVAVVPLVVLLRACRTGLLDLILSTVDELGASAGLRAD
jgi:hypothetical protein